MFYPLATGLAMGICREEGLMHSRNLSNWSIDLVGVQVKAPQSRLIWGASASAARLRDWAVKVQMDERQGAGWTLRLWLVCSK